MGTERSPVQLVATIVGATFVLVGVAGFIPGLTTDLYDGLEFAGDDGTSELLGIFKVSILHNIVHLLFGVVGLALAKTMSGARTYLIGGGIIYLALGVLGLLGGAAWIPANDADNGLHLFLGAAMITLGFLTTRSSAQPQRMAA